MEQGQGGLIDVVSQCRQIAVAMPFGSNLMNAWSMFAHSVRLVLNNLDVALRVSLVLYLLQVAAQAYAFSAGIMDIVEGPDGMPVSSASPGQMWIYFLLSLVAVVASLWIAVAWHRFVLLSEIPQGWMPLWPGAKIFGYLGRSILIGLAIVLVLIPVGFVTALLGMPILTVAASVGVAAYVFFRLSPILPAIALGQDMSFGDALTATKDSGGALFGLAGLMIAAAIILQLPTMLSGDPNSLLSLIYGIVVGWFATMIGISLLTTVYGHYVEKRGID